MCFKNNNNKNDNLAIAPIPAVNNDFDASMDELAALFGKLSISESPKSVPTPEEVSDGAAHINKEENKLQVVPTNQQNDSATQKEHATPVPPQDSSSQTIAASLATIALAEKIEQDLMKTAFDGAAHLQDGASSTKPNIVPTMETNNDAMELDDENEVWEASMQELACLFSKQSLVCNQMEIDEDEMEVDDENELWEASMQELACLFSKQSLVCNQMEIDEDEMEIGLPITETDGK